MGWRVGIAACLLALLGLGGGGALACEEFVEIEAQQLKEYRDKLVEQEADPLDRMFAFQQLVCSSNPVMRAYAVREGLKSATDPIVREQIMFDSMMQKTRLEIEITAGSGTTAKDKEFIQQQSGIWVIPIAFRSKTEGCLSLYQRDQCVGTYSVFIKGDKVALTYEQMIGEFQLADSNELVGFVRVQNNKKFSRIPAIIKLN